VLHKLGDLLLAVEPARIAYTLRKIIGLGKKTFTALQIFEFKAFDIRR
jgi:hypothetical protein